MCKVILKATSLRRRGEGGGDWEVDGKEEREETEEEKRNRDERGGKEEEI